MKLNEIARHIEILNKEHGELCISVGIMKNDIVWIKEFISKSCWALGIPLVLILVGVGLELLK